MECLDEAALADLASNQMAPELRAQAMAHVEHCAACDERLQSLVFGGDVATADVIGPASHIPDYDDDELAGTKLGRYLIIEMVGKGALGVVYSAYDPELDRRIAIKVLRRRVTDDAEFQESLRNEARLMAKLSHPNIVPVFDVGIAGGRLFIAMELIVGQTLREWGRFDDRGWKEYRDVYCKAAEGLAAAHDAGLIYRDFKPSNVMIGNDGQVRVLDFGIARLGRDGSGWGQGATGTHAGIGTPGYMAPEQYHEDQPIDGRADQYAFCVSLYEALYGNRPFGGRTFDLVRKTTLEQVWSEPTRDPGLPLWMRAALLRGLSLDPNDRFPDMPALLHALNKDKRSRRTQIAALTLAVLGTAAITSVATLMFSEIEPADRDRIEQLTIDARAAAAKSHYVYPPTVDPHAPTAYTLVLELEQTEGDAAEPADERAEQLRQEFGGTLLGLGDEYYDQEGGRPFAMDYYLGALMFLPEDEHALSRLRMTPGEIAALRERAAEQSFSPEELAAAEPLAVLAEPDQQVREQKLIALAKRAGGRSTSTDFHVAKLLGQPLAPPTADEIDPVEATDGADALAAEDDDATVDTEALIEPVDETTGDGGAEPSAEGGRAGQSRPSSGSTTRDPAQSAALAREATAAFKSNRLELAEKLYHRALEFDSKNTAALSGLAELYFERSKYRKSLKFAKRAVKRSPERGDLRILLGDAHFKVLEYAEARRHYDKARALGHKSANKRLEKLEKTVGQ